MYTHTIKLLFLLPLVLLQGCANRTPYEEASDPIEPVNRAVYRFNDTLDRWVLKPVAQGYEKALPPTARTGVRNFFSNLTGPLTIVNDILQGKPALAAQDTMRFGFNSIFGVAGLMDVASDWGLPKRSEDFGQTFAVWGFGEGPYIVWPLLGPSNLRDTAAFPLDWWLDPVAQKTEGRVKYGLLTVRVVSKRADLLTASKVLDAAAIDPYVQIREAFRQTRWNKIHDGDPPEPDFFDEELMD